MTAPTTPLPPWMPTSRDDQHALAAALREAADQLNRAAIIIARAGETENKG